MKYTYRSTYVICVKIFMYDSAKDPRTCGFSHSEQNTKKSQRYDTMKHAYAQMLSQLQHSFKVWSNLRSMTFYLHTVVVAWLIQQSINCPFTHFCQLCFCQHVISHSGWANQSQRSVLCSCPATDLQHRVCRFSTYLHLW